MVNRDQRSALIIQARMAVLKALSLVHPSILGFGYIAAMCPEIADDETLAKDLDVLIEKGYVRCVNCPAEERRLPRWAERKFKITAAGTDLVNGIIRDATLAM